ncbi:MAG: serine--tRNA ligase [Candidatus Yanofskybacteria bacterium RIFCSPHIGHO2_01_FULL_39_8b]|uniref:Serine--tRNA ligase n=1 Tax=Candidatus Yanofskybacteria bacterium RIFCSPHIGHO2_01_FULL_39_8b TaxID=1802659 RepID=A0A1F8EGF7_9BACT|nr:MAG: serine--tRNA ligase [Candidatus Yanofskybacteria bacterium RIFCSPHIGHO2_01_FULL_39_8b]
MLDIKFIRQNQEEVKKSIADRGMNVDVDELLGLDEKRRVFVQKIGESRAIRNKGSNTKPLPEDIDKMRILGDKIAKTEKESKELEVYYTELLEKVPNMIHPDVPRGGEENFKVLEEYGEITKFDFGPKDHESLMLGLDLIDFERGAKVAGNKFYFAKNDLVRLNQALLNYGIDMVTKHGYVLMETPDLAKDSILSGIGFNPRGQETQIYSIENSDLSLIGTAEITLGGYHADEILDLSKGPKKYVAFSHCFRTEAGSYGRESKGLYRLHQFTKLEMFIYCKPEESESLHKEILDIEKEIVKGLKLPYRIIDTASGDLGASAYRKYDIEAWMPMKNPSTGSGHGGYGEITSTSNCTDYQARRLGVRYRQNDGDIEYVHTLNGTAVVSSRFPLAIIENYQTKEGTIKIPEVLQKYLNGLKEIK